ncbi:MAG: acylphosphatase [Clostridium sp.]|uniref:acylphosphatase n=1 Tax=Clostridium sp. TaxID=1506 RepID=UPI003F3A1652
MERLLINVTGKVQGVGFRYLCQRLALKYSLVGTAKNLDDGTVDIVVQGDTSNLKLFISDVLKGNRFITISTHTVTTLTIDSTLKKFNISY